MKIHLITCCFNEERLLPYFLKHYSFCDLITVYDDNSSDRSVEIIKSFPNTEVIQQNTGMGNKFDDSNVLNIKNEKYKLDRNYDWVIIVDIDEFLYHPDLLRMLEEYKSRGITLPFTTGYDMYSKTFPTENRQIYELARTGRCAPNHSKWVIFNPQIDINYSIGAHHASPTGNVKYTGEVAELKVLHYVYLSHEYMTQKRKKIFERLCQDNKNKGWGTHNDSYSQMTEKEYNDLEKLMIRVI